MVLCLSSSHYFTTLSLKVLECCLVYGTFNISIVPCAMAKIIILYGIALGLCDFAVGSPCDHIPPPPPNHESNIAVSSKAAAAAAAATATAHLTRVTNFSRC